MSRSVFNVQRPLFAIWFIIIAFVVIPPEKRKSKHHSFVKQILSRCHRLAENIQRLTMMDKIRHLCERENSFVLFCYRIVVSVQYTFGLLVKMPTFLATNTPHDMCLWLKTVMTVFLHRFIYSRWFVFILIVLLFLTLFIVHMMCMRVCILYTFERAIKFVQGNDHRLLYVIKTFAVCHNQTQSCIAHTIIYLFENIIMNFVALNSNLSFEGWLRWLWMYVYPLIYWHCFIDARASLN